MDAGVDLSPPRVNGDDLLLPRVKAGVGFEAGWEEAVWPEVGAPPKPKEGLFAGVAAGVVLPRLNKGFGVACGPASPPGMLGCVDAPLFASCAVSLLPKLNGPALPGVEVGFAPKRDSPLLAPAPAPVCPNKLFPGGGPAGVVEGSVNVLLGAGVAAGVEDSARLLASVYYI